MFVSAAHPVCSATEASTGGRRTLTDVISIIRKNQLLKENDLTNLVASELRIARNAVYACHGRFFNAELSIFFGERTWYLADKEFTEKRLTSTGVANIKLIQKAERGNPFRPDNSTMEGAMRLYLDAFFRGDSDLFLSLCHRKHPPRFTSYEIGTLKLLGTSIMDLKELETDFAKKGFQWTDFFGDAGGMAQYRWFVTGNAFEEWKKEGEIFRRPSDGKYIYVKWQVIEGRWYIAEIAEILV